MTEKLLDCTLDDDGIAWITLDLKGERQNVLRAEHLPEAEAILDDLAPRPELRGVVFRSAKPESFVAGADISMLHRCRDAAEATALARDGQRLTNRLASMNVPVVAAIRGTCLGGGLELALACHYRICTDEPSTELGLPEVRIGVLPGSGGTQRLPRLVGAQQALDLMLTGRRLRPHKAARIGLVDECIPAAHLEAAARGAVQRAHATGRDRGRNGGRLQRLVRWGTERNRLGRGILFREVRRRTRRDSGGHYPAADAIIDCVETGLRDGLHAGLSNEAAAFGRLAVTPVAQELRFLYFATTELRKERGADAVPIPVHRVGVFGGGLMGAGIASVTVDQAERPVRLCDPDTAALGRAARHVHGRIEARRRRGSLSAFEARCRQHRLSLTPRPDRVQGQAVIEAVFEDLALKHQVLARFEEHACGDDFFASNTSSLPIASIAARARNPERVIGMHYFSPVERMALVEIIPHEGTAPEVTAGAVQLARDQGKTPIVVGDSPGFFVNRILAPYLNEAGLLLQEGVAIDALDAALRRYGFPMGPFELLDYVGFGVAARVEPILHEAFGARMAPSGVLSSLLDAGWDGRQRGFYGKDRLGRRRPDPAVYAHFGVRAGSRSTDDDACERLVMAMLNEAARCLDEGVVRTPTHGDVAAVFGIGFPPFRGGPYRAMDRRGLTGVCDALVALERTHGERFSPGGRLKDEAPAPFHAGVPGVDAALD